MKHPIKALSCLKGSERKALVKAIVEYGDKQFRGRKGAVSKEEIVDVFIDGLQKHLICDEILMGDAVQPQGDGELQNNYRHPPPASPP